MGLKISLFYALLCFLFWEEGSTLKIRLLPVTRCLVVNLYHLQHMEELRSFPLKDRLSNIKMHTCISKLPDTCIRYFSPLMSFFFFFLSESVVAERYSFFMLCFYSLFS